MPKINDGQTIEISSLSNPHFIIPAKLEMKIKVTRKDRFKEIQGSISGNNEQKIIMDAKVINT